MTLPVTLVAIVRDHSVSMTRLVQKAKADYNTLVGDLQGSYSPETGEVYVTVLECGIDTRHTYPLVGSTRVGILPAEHVSNLPLLTSYRAVGGSTPLVDAIYLAAERLKSHAQLSYGGSDTEVNFLVLVTTDGDENDSNITARELRSMIEKHTKTGKWTFAARVPKGNSRKAVALGFPAGNVLEWELTERGQERATVSTSSAMRSFMSSDKKGTTTFFANIAEVAIEEVKAQLIDISGQVSWLLVEPSDAGGQIREFVERKTGKTMPRGSAHYNLVKKEEVQASKRIVIRDTVTGAVYAGLAARQMLGIPSNEKIRLSPSNLGNYEVYIQSTSVNRKLDSGTRILYWEGK